MVSPDGLTIQSKRRQNGDAYCFGRVKKGSGPTPLAPDLSPTGGGSAWHETTVSIPLSSIACVSTSFCLGGGAGGLEYSADPAGGAATWKDADVGGSTPFGSISCLTASLCVTTHGADGVLTSTRPAGSTWKQVTLSSTVTGVTCPSAAECVGVGGPGVVTTTDPAGGASAWHYATAAVAAGAVLSCPATTLCVSGTADGGIVTSADPTGGAAARPRPVQVDGSTVITASACPAASLCVAGDALGQVLSSADPAAGKWKLARVTPSAVSPDQAGILAVSCPRPSFCVAAAHGGYVLTSADPASGQWQEFTLTEMNLTAPTCPTTSLCLAVTGFGQVVYTKDAAAGLPGWHTVNSGLPDLIGLSCPTASRCAGFSISSAGADVAVSSTRPLAAGAWTQTVIRVPRQADFYLTSLSCPSASLCLLSDSRGDFFAGT